MSIRFSIKGLSSPWTQGDILYFNWLLHGDVLDNNVLYDSFIRAVFSTIQ